MKYKYYLACNYCFTNKEKRLLYEAFGEYEKIYHLSKEEMETLSFLSKESVLKSIEFKESFDLDKEYESFLQSGMCFSCFNDEDFPEKLRNIHNGPFQLFYFGRLPKNDEKIIYHVAKNIP